MKLKKMTWCFVLLAFASSTSTPNLLFAEKKFPLWPNPQQVSREKGSFEVSGVSICIPAQANEKSKAIAKALSEGLSKHLKLKSPLKVEKEGSAGTSTYVLSIGGGSETWKGIGKKLALDHVHKTLRDQAYYLEVTPKGIVIASPNSWGLFYGTITLLQLAQFSAEGTKIPCVSILDWPDMEIRAAHVTRLPNADRELGGAYSQSGKANMVVWENFNIGFSPESHPELQRGQSFAEKGKNYGGIAQEVRSRGVEVVPLRNMSIGHRRQSGLNPYVFLGDNETYYWAMKEVVDDELEVFTPRYFHVGLDEERDVRFIKYPVRNLLQWREVAVKMTQHLRRRGVRTMMWSEMLFKRWAGKNPSYDWAGCVGGKFPNNYFKFTAGFPKDLLLVPWYYRSKSPDEYLDGKGDLRRIAKTGMGLMAASRELMYEAQAQAAKTLKKEAHNIMGVMSTAWGAKKLEYNKFPRYPEYVRRTAGANWNSDKPGSWAPKNKARKVPATPFYGDHSVDTKNFSWPKAQEGSFGLECLFDADVPNSLIDAIKKIESPEWRIWLHAREQLVAAGFPASEALLTAMSKAEGENRERLEGCLSRNARDARNGRKRGALNVSKILPFLKDKSEVVRDIAAEVLASFGGEGIKKVRASIADSTAGASCIRALRLAKDLESLQEITAIVGDEKSALRSRVEGAKMLGRFRVESSASALRTGLAKGTDHKLKKAALWSLALIQCKEADTEISKLLDSKDEDTRYRAAIALAILQSSQTKKLIPWLEKDRHSLELAAWVMWKTWDKKDFEKVLKAAAKKQKDENSQERLGMLVQMIYGKGESNWKY